MLEYAFSMKEWEGEVPSSLPRRKTISLCMIVKNEEEYLAQCLESAEGVVDEVIVVDTGSSDRTVEIARNHGAKVSFFPWNGSFADARNFALEQATCDWILILDADEILSPDDKPAIPKLAQRDDLVGFFFRIKNLVNDEAENPDYQEHFFIRLFPRHPDIRYEGDIHEQIRFRMRGENGEDLSIPIDRVLTLVTIFHYGYAQRIFSERKKAERNIGILENILSREKENGFHHFNLGITYWSAGDLEKAFAEYQMARKLVNREMSFYPLILMGGAHILATLGKSRQAIEWAKEAANLLPEAPDTHFTLASAYQAAGMAGEAIEEYRKATECTPEYVAHIVHDPSTATWKPWNQIGAIEIKRGRYAEGIQAFEKALGYNPGSHEQVHNLAYAHLKAGNYAAAEDLFRKLVLSRKDSGDFWRLVEVFRKQGKVEEIWAAAEEVGGGVEVYESLGFTFLRDGETELARRAFERLVERSPSGAALNNLGAIFVKLGDLGRALDCFERAMRMDSRNLEAWINRARCHLMMGEADRAYACLEGFPVENQHEAVLQTLAEAAVGSSRIAEALERRGGSPAFVKRIAMVLNQKERAVEALGLLDRLVGVSPGDPHVHYQRGMSLLKLGEHGLAVESFSKALALKPDMAEARGGLLGAQTLWKLNSNPIGVK